MCAKVLFLHKRSVFYDNHSSNDLVTIDILNRTSSANVYSLYLLLHTTISEVIASFCGTLLLG